MGKEYLEPDCDDWCKHVGGGKMYDVMYVKSNGVCSNVTDVNILCSVLKTPDNVFSASVSNITIEEDVSDLPYTK